MNILVACEESQRVCIAFRNKGHNAFSCDLQDCSGGFPQFHIKRNVLEILEPSLIKDVYNRSTYFHGIDFYTCTGDYHRIGEWDMIIAHPPCTRLCSSGQRWLYFGSKTYQINKLSEQKFAISFFLAFTNLSCKRVAIENPVGIMSKLYRKPDCIYNPYDFLGSTETKRTCLWLKGLPALVSNRPFPLDKSLRSNSCWRANFNGISYSFGSSELSRLRSQTSIAVANAMAEQWG